MHYFNCRTADFNTYSSVNFNNDWHKKLFIKPNNNNKLYVFRQVLFGIWMCDDYHCDYAAFLAIKGERSKYCMGTGLGIARFKDGQLPDPAAHQRRQLRTDCIFDSRTQTRAHRTHTLAVKLPLWLPFNTNTLYLVPLVVCL